MKVAEKLTAIRNAHRNTQIVPFPTRQMILGELAKDLGLKMWLDDGVFEICTRRPGSSKKPLLTLPQ